MSAEGSASGRGRGKGPLSDWVRAATRPRLLGILVILLAGAVLCIRLGAWQLDRAQLRGDQAEEVAQSQRVQGPAVPLAQVISQGDGLTQQQLGQRVEVRGEYVAEHQVVVTGRGFDGQPGSYVLSALRISGGPDDGVLIPVVRGWAVQPGPSALEVPAGEVVVTGFLAGPEAAETGIPPDLPTGGQVEVISPAQLVNHWGGPMHSSYLRLETQEPPGSADLAPIGPPQITGGGLNIRNLAYAAEWWIFGGFALVLWWRMVRDEVRHLRTATLTPAAERS